MELERSEIQVAKIRTESYSASVAVEDRWSEADAFVVASGRRVVECPLCKNSNHVCVQLKDMMVNMTTVQMTSAVKLFLDGVPVLNEESANHSGS